MRILTLVILLMSQVIYPQCPEIKVSKDKETITIISRSKVDIFNEVSVLSTEYYIPYKFSLEENSFYKGKYLYVLKNKSNNKLIESDKLSIFLNLGVCFCKEGIFILENNIDYDYDYNFNRLTFAESSYINLYSEEGHLLWSNNDDYINLSILEQGIYYLETDLNEEIIKIIKNNNNKQTKK